MREAFVLMSHPHRRCRQEVLPFFISSLIGLGLDLGAIGLVLTRDVPSPSAPNSTPSLCHAVAV